METMLRMIYLLVKQFPGQLNKVLFNAHIPSSKAKRTQHSTNTFRSRYCANSDRDMPVSCPPGEYGLEKCVGGSWDSIIPGCYSKGAPLQAWWSGSKHVKIFLPSICIIWLLGSTLKNLGQRFWNGDLDGVWEKRALTRQKSKQNLVNETNQGENNQSHNCKADGGGWRAMGSHSPLASGSPSRLPWQAGSEKVGGKETVSQEK